MYRNGVSTTDLKQTNDQLYAFDMRFRSVMENHIVIIEQTITLHAIHMEIGCRNFMTRCRIQNVRIPDSTPF